MSEAQKSAVNNDERGALLAGYVELNMSNYGPDDVDALNAWASDAYNFIARAASPQAPDGAEAILPAWFDAFLVNVCEIPDRNSPEGEPDAVVATLEELKSCALNAIEATAPEQSTGICLFCSEPIDGEHESDCPQAAASSNTLPRESEGE